MQKHRLLEQALPSLFPFSLPPPPPLFAPATQAKDNARFALTVVLNRSLKAVMFLLTTTVSTWHSPFAWRASKYISCLWCKSLEFAVKSDTTRQMMTDALIREQQTTHEVNVSAVLFSPFTEKKSTWVQFNYKCSHCFRVQKQ